MQRAATIRRVRWLIFRDPEIRETTLAAMSSVRVEYVSSGAQQKWEEPFHDQKSFHVALQL